MRRRRPHQPRAPRRCRRDRRRRMRRGSRKRPTRRRRGRGPGSRRSPSRRRPSGRPTGRPSSTLRAAADAAVSAAVDAAGFAVGLGTAAGATNGPVLNAIAAGHAALAAAERADAAVDLATSAVANLSPATLANGEAAAKTSAEAHVLQALLHDVQVAAYAKSAVDAKEAVDFRYLQVVARNGQAEASRALAVLPRPPRDRRQGRPLVAAPGKVFKVVGDKPIDFKLSYNIRPKRRRTVSRSTNGTSGTNRDSRFVADQRGPRPAPSDHRVVRDSNIRGLTASPSRGEVRIRLEPIDGVEISVHLGRREDARARFHH